jgi:hypothetical protein
MIDGICGEKKSGVSRNRAHHVRARGRDSALVAMHVHVAALDYYSIHRHSGVVRRWREQETETGNEYVHLLGVLSSARPTAMHMEHHQIRGLIIYKN